LAQAILAQVLSKVRFFPLVADAVSRSFFWHRAMVRGLFIRVCLLAALALVATAKIQDDGSIMRRQKMGSSQVHLGPGGELSMMEASEQADSFCNYDYPQGADNSNECPAGSDAIDIESHCKHAARILEMVVADGTKDTDQAFEVSEAFVNPSSSPKNCFIQDGKVRFNPTDSTAAPSSYLGKPLCHKKVYIDGTEGENSDAGCTGDYEPITNSEECLWAHDCSMGVAFCKEQTLLTDYNGLNVENTPSGCYRAATTGCHGFNPPGANAGTGTLTGKKAVCRLTSHTFDPNARSAALHGNSTLTNTN